LLGKLSRLVSIIGIACFLNALDNSIQAFVKTRPFR
jgi:hypothetical protein